MATYILRRLLQAIPIVIGISVVSFAIVHLTPGSPVDKFRTPRVSPETINEPDPPLRARPAAARPVREVVHATSGRSRATTRRGATRSPTGCPVRDKIFARIPSHAVADRRVAARDRHHRRSRSGSSQAVRQYSWSDKIITTFETIGYAMPTFWLGLMLKQTFAVAARTSSRCSGRTASARTATSSTSSGTSCCRSPRWRSSRSRAGAATCGRRCSRCCARTTSGRPRSKGLTERSVDLQARPPQRPHPDRHAARADGPALLVRAPRSPRRSSPGPGSAGSACRP